MYTAVLGVQIPCYNGTARDNTNEVRAEAIYYFIQTKLEIKVICLNV